MARQVETTYGDALLELALEEGSLNMLYEEAQALVTVLQENEELLRILKHPQIDRIFSSFFVFIHFRSCKSRATNAATPSCNYCMSRKAPSIPGRRYFLNFYKKL